MSEPALPGPDANVVHVHTSAGQIGPFTRKEIKRRVEARELSPSDFVWWDGLSGWTPIKGMPELLEIDGAPAPQISDDDRLDGIFGKLVAASWEYQESHAFASHIDEVFLGAVIAAQVEDDYMLIDLSSDGSHHYTRFEHTKDGSRIILRVTHLTPGLATSKVLGQRASVVVGYGERLKNFSAVFSALKAEYKSGLIQGDEPGSISVDGDMTSQYVYAQVPLYLKMDDYIERSYKLNTRLLQEHLGGTVHALRKYLRGRFN